MTQYDPVTPSGDALALVTIVVGSLLVVLFAFTLGRSYWLARDDRRCAARRDDRRSELLTRLYGPDPDWTSWVDGLDAADRTVVRSLVYTQLRWVRGTERERLRDLASVLGLDARAERLFASERRYERLQGLTWLALLGRPVDAETVLDRCRDHPDTRAAGARLLADTDHSEARPVGTELLLAPGRPLSVLGVDTLYQLYKHDAAELVAWATRERERWDESLFIQVLDVFGECSTVGPGVSLEWVLAGLDAASPRVRAAALEALTGYGWRESVRTAVVGEREAPFSHREEREPLVRRTAYRLYGEWATPDALDRLAEAVWRDPDDRARVEAARALQRADCLSTVGTGERAPTDGASGTDHVVAWVDATAGVDG
ncbi:HEAT repeat domain-containing protein [Halomarina oriensis]|uniref:HEAT repeat domain-containing protein n=1 Tax=Halomarina oriensis TaxID=671145 RepID=A0A6B0GNX6_9EURY|nr:HEAT repeat domain-containing protein [Halomarina oriensis]MWG36390.1 HEAT repeat domain-containing protein [Halomarina oriensis]